MFEFTLPGLGQNDKLNFIFLDTYYANQSLGNYKNILFNIVGNFPQSIWAGNSNNINQILLYENIQEIISNYSKLNTVMYLDFSNIVFSEELFSYDPVGLTVINLMNGLANVGLEVSNEKAYNYFKNKCPLYKMIASNKWIDEEKEFEENNFYKRIIFPKDLDYLTINNKKRYEIELNNPCNDCSKEKWGNCMIEENNNIISFSKNTIYNKCPEYTTNIQANWNNNNINDYIKLGFTNFRLPNFLTISPIIQLSEYTKIFIKEKYHKEFFNLLLLKYYED